MFCLQCRPIIVLPGKIIAERDVRGTRGTLEGHLFGPGATNAPTKILTTPANLPCFVYHVDQLLLQSQRK